MAWAGVTKGLGTVSVSDTAPILGLLEFRESKVKCHKSEENLQLEWKCQLAFQKKITLALRAFPPLSSTKYWLQNLSRCCQVGIVLPRGMKDTLNRIGYEAVGLRGEKVSLLCTIICIGSQKSEIHSARQIAVSPAVRSRSDHAGRKPESLALLTAKTP